MIQARFFTDREQLTGFRISGHAGAGVAGEDIVCAAVSSAVYMAANTITDILHIPAHIVEDDGFFELRLSQGFAESRATLEGLRLHLRAVQEQYPNRVRLMNTEV